MTANLIVDVSLHNASVPATYVAPGILQAFGVAATQGSTTGTFTATPTTLIPTFVGNTYTVTPAGIVQGPDADIIAGFLTGTGAAIIIPVGFFPTKVEVINWTGVVKWEWMYGAPATDSLKVVTAGTETTDTGSAIVVTPDAAGGNGDVCYVVISATLAVNAQVLSFRIEA